MKKLVYFTIAILLILPIKVNASVLNEIPPYVYIEGINESDYIISKTIKENDVIVEIKDIKTNDNYSWSFDKNKIGNKISLNFNIDFKTANKEKIDSIAGDQEKLYVSFSHHGDLPSEAIIKVDIKDKFKDGDKLYLYYYNEETEEAELIEKDIVVNDGYVEFKIEHCSDYFLTEDVVYSVESRPNVLSYVILALGGLAFILMSYVIFKR